MDVDPKVTRVDPTLRVNPSTSTGAGAERGHEASTLLREGRVLAGRVVAREGTGQYLLALGGERLRAETSIPLEPGQRLLLRVAGSGEAAVLELIAGAGSDVDKLLHALRGVVGEPRSVGELLTSLAASLRAQLARPGATPSAALAPELAALLEGLERAGLAPGDGAEGLARLLARAGTRYEAQLAAALNQGRGFEALAGNLKALLLGVLDRLERGESRDLVTRLLAAFEGEQLLNAARRSAGEPLVWTFPFADGSGWTTARLGVPARGEEGGEGRGEEDAGARLVLDVRFSRLGPVRAELVLARGRLVVALEVADASLEERLRAALPELVERLDDGARAVEVRVRSVRPETLEPAASELDVALLRSHHLLDLEG